MTTTAFTPATGVCLADLYERWQATPAIVENSPASPEVVAADAARRRDLAVERLLGLPSLTHPSARSIIIAAVEAEVAVQQLDLAPGLELRVETSGSLPAVHGFIAGMRLAEPVVDLSDLVAESAHRVHAGIASRVFALCGALEDAAAGATEAGVL